MTSLCPGCSNEAEWRPGGQFVADLEHRVWHVACVRKVLKAITFDGRGLCPGCSNEAEWRPGGQFVADLEHRVWHIACVRRILQSVGEVQRCNCPRCGSDQLTQQMQPGGNQPWVCTQCGPAVPERGARSQEEHDGRPRST